MLITLAIFVVLFISGRSFMRQEQFGKMPTGKRMERIRKSPNYRNGSFQNLSHTPDLTEGSGYVSVLWEFLFKKKVRLRPKGIIPSIKTDLLKLDIKENVLVWFGHSSYFIQIDGKRILVDPVFCGYASPVSFTTKAFPGSNQYTPDDMPEIDFLFISHDHWDHLDHTSFKALMPKIKQVITGLGTGEHLEHWGYDSRKIIELDWNENYITENGFSIHAVPARHFSGRGLKRNQALWISFVLYTPGMTLFLGGDSGYDAHFADIGDKFGPFDLAIIENGQYDKSWRYIHLLPDEIMKAASDLRTKKLLPVHHSKFAIANHSWDEPLIKITANSKGNDIQILTPLIGEEVNLNKNAIVYREWWKNVD